MSEKLQVLYFSAPWCGPCKAFGPAFNEVVAEFDDIDVQKINIDEDSQSAVKHEVTSIPTLIFKRGDNVVFKTKGLISKNHLKDLIKLYNGTKTNEHQGHIPEQTTE
jgi:thioredoxin 1